MRIDSSGNALTGSSRQQDNDDTSPVESQPFFEDEDSAAWASFSSNVAIAYEPLSNVPVRTFKDFFFHIFHYLGCETSSTAKEPLYHPYLFDEASSCPEEESCCGSGILDVGTSFIW